MVTNFQSQNLGCRWRSVLCVLMGALLLAATAVQAQKINKLFKATRTSTAITLDGVFGETAWTKGKNFQDTMVYGQVNNTATFGVVWDNTYLYVGVKVLDVPPFHTNTTDTWNNDGCEFAFEGNNAKRVGGWGVPNEECDWKYELHVGAASDTTTYHHNVTSDPDGSCHIKKLSDGYTMEFRLLWTSIKRGLTSTTPAENDVIGFDIANNDCDSVAGGTISQARWNGADGDESWFANPSTWGCLVLGNGEGEANGVEGDVSPVPQTFVLEQNYPNPFNPSTEIRYQLPMVSDVKLIVVDMLGREIATLVNGVQAAGAHSATFDARSFSSGMYFYKLTAGNFTQVKKMVLTK